MRSWRNHPESVTKNQEIILRLHNAAQICRIQVLAHQFLIRAATTPSSQTFEYLGYISLSDNSATKFKSRELQSVAVGPQKGTHVKLRLGPNHPNHLNTNNQV
ncbi:Centrosomal protein of 104 kDa [Pseudolycoriella hygida]|uniref:Centrosomal protein of 104 kDa n=1 Tax=Pseudolycoriella hygida TaxID=35572 RepID=A0A9Q0NCP0_9DIPT|nr:Centrosomal protein of 104 kDa [Pseudolycoriella hygida]